MSEPYLGEVKLFSFGKVPTGWSLCDGTILTVQQNQALWSLIGNKFGGQPPTTFGLPDLRGRTPLGLAPTAPDATRRAYPTDGASGGSETVQLTVATVPPHTHSVYGVAAQAGQVTPAAGLLASTVSGTPGSTTDFSIYQPATTWTGDATLAPGTVGTVGGQPHNNMQPFLTLNFCIATSNALYPQRP